MDKRRITPEPILIASLYLSFQIGPPRRSTATANYRFFNSRYFHQVRSRAPRARSPLQRTRTTDGGGTAAALVRLLLTLARYNK